MSLLGLEHSWFCFENSKGRLPYAVDIYMENTIGHGIGKWTFVWVHGEGCFINPLIEALLLGGYGMGRRPTPINNQIKYQVQQVRFLKHQKRSENLWIIQGFCWWFLTMCCSDMCTIFWRHKLGIHFMATSFFNILAMGNYLIFTLSSRNQNRLNFISRSLVWTRAEKIVNNKGIPRILVILILLKSDKLPRRYA